MRRSGVFIVVVASLAWAGCDWLGEDATIELDEGEVQLERGARVNEVRVGGAGAADRLAPTEITAAPGDAVRFVVEDRRAHALVFVEDGLSPENRTFLSETNQLRGPPLVNEGATWVVSLAEAPPGRYPYVCLSHDAGGVITVELED